MEINIADIYRCPACGLKFALKTKNKTGSSVIEGELVCTAGHQFEIKDSIPDLTWPKELAEIDLKTRAAYETLADQYDQIASFPFETFKCSEHEIRERMTDMLLLKADSKVLEVGGGNGRGSEHIVKRLNNSGKLFFQELSPAFLKKSFERLHNYSSIIDFSVANACYLSFPDNYFDAAHHFGGVSTFSDIKRFFKELTRVVKPGGKIVIGDESIAPWLRETDFGKIMSTSNPLFNFDIPLKDIPVEARDVKIEWIMMGSFFIIEFTVGEGEPAPDYHVPIPTEKGGTRWTRYYGNLEGVTDETKELAKKARAKSGKSMHEWLDHVVKEAAKKELGDSEK